MLARYGYLANKWTIIALALATMGAVLLVTLLPVVAQQDDAIEFAEIPDGTEDPNLEVADFTAVDPEGTATTTNWAVLLSTADVSAIDGIEATDVHDGDHFKIDKGILSFAAAPNFEDPSGGGDGGTSNTYALVVSAKVGSETSYKKVEVKVTNVDEPATTGIELSLIQPREGSRIRVLFTDKVGNPFLDAEGESLSPDINEAYPTGPDAASGIVDPDGDKDVTTDAVSETQRSIPADNVAYQWSRGGSPNGPWTDIEDATGAVYTVVDDDRTRYLRVMATYEDKEGEDKELEAVSLYPTLRLRTDNVPPKFADSEPTTLDPIDLPDAEVEDGATEGTVVGSYAAARETAHGERLTYFLEQTSSATAAQADYFQIDRATGQVTVGLGKTLQDEADEHDNVVGEVEPSGGFAVRIRAVDGYEDIQASPITANFGTGDLTITVDGVDEDPVFTEAGGKMTHEFPENMDTTSAFYTFIAYDPETDGAGTATYSLSGPDAGQFVTTAFGTSGELIFDGARNYESAADANKDNIYEITVKASAASTIGGAAQPEKSNSINVTVEVTNVDEPGVVSLSARNPRIGVPISSRVVSDTDGAVSGVTWRWERDETGTADIPTTSCPAVATDGWEEAKGDGSNTATYTPQLADDGKCLRAVASYTDPAGTGGTANQASDVAVVKARNLAPMFENGMETRYVQENAVAEAVVVEDDDGTTAVQADDIVVATDDNDAEPEVTDGPISYTLSGADAMYFTIDNVGDTVGDTTVAADGAGQIRVSAAGAGNLDFETRRTYRVTVTATDRSGLYSSVNVTINIVDDDEGPEIMRGRLAVSGLPLVPYTSMGTGDVATYTAVGRDAEGATWSLSGDDAADFHISTDGVLTFNTPPNSASPVDANMDNVYMVTVEATATSGGMPATKPVTVNVGMATEAADPTSLNDYTSQQRFDLDGNGIVDASEIREALIIWAEDNPEN